MIFLYKCLKYSIYACNKLLEFAIISMLTVLHL